VPELQFDVRWPDGSARTYYSPSLVVEDHLSAGEAYPVPEFVRRAREALRIASERVEQKYGFPCSRAAASLAAIERDAATRGTGEVRVESLRR
jgi:uncharacterized repeat protein (TIGR04042 family)